jgi:hypothetical protein
LISDKRHVLMFLAMHYAVLEFEIAIPRRY